MSNTVEAGQGESIPLTFNNILEDGSITVSAKVYDVDGSQVGSTQTLSHIADGLYQVSYAVGDPGNNSDILTVIYIPSGDDNSTAVDIIKVRTISPFGAGASASGGGLVDDDIKAIVEAIKKELPIIEEVNLIPIENKLNELIKKEITILPPDLTGVNKSIDVKMAEIRSAVNKLTPLIRIVTDLNSKVNAIDLSKINSISQVIKSLTSEVQNVDKSMGLIQSEIEGARDKLLAIESPTKTDMESLKELMFTADELQVKRFEVIVLTMLSLLEKITVELKSSNGNFGKTLKEVEALKQTLAIFNLNTLQNEVL